MHGAANFGDPFRGKSIALVITPLRNHPQDHHPIALYDFVDNPDRTVYQRILSQPSEVGPVTRAQWLTKFKRISLEAFQPLRDTMYRCAIQT